MVFEELAQPQSIPFEGNSVQIDSAVQEATFVITHDTNSEPVRLSAPDGKTWQHDRAGEGVRWFASTRSDLITVQNPAAGIWKVTPSPKAGDGHVLILTDLELEVGNLPEIVLGGDAVNVTAQLKDKGQTVQAPELLAKLTLQAIVHTPDGGAFEMSDDGGHEDGEPRDGVYGILVTGPEKDGSCDLEILAKAPTFQRRLLRKMTIVNRWFQVQIEKDFAAPGERIPIRLTVDNMLFAIRE
jgi:uncharacterized protein (TIGR03503 family)